MILAFDEFKKYITKVEKYCEKKGITEDNFDKRLDDPKIENNMESFYNELEKIIKKLADGYNYTLLKKSYESAIKKSEFEFVLEPML